jgi:hypothetical protein
VSRITTEFIMRFIPIFRTAQLMVCFRYGTTMSGSREMALRNSEMVLPVYVGCSLVDTTRAEPRRDRVAVHSICSCIQKALTVLVPTRFHLQNLFSVNGSANILGSQHRCRKPANKGEWRQGHQVQEPTSTTQSEAEESSGCFIKLSLGGYDTHS